MRPTFQSWKQNTSIGWMAPRFCGAVRATDAWSGSAMERFLIAIGTTELSRATNPTARTSRRPLGVAETQEISTATFERQPNRDGISAPDGSPMAIASAPSGPRLYCRWISTVSWFTWNKPLPRPIGSRGTAIGHLTSLRWQFVARRRFEG